MFSNNGLLRAWVIRSLFTSKDILGLMIMRPTCPENFILIGPGN